MSVSPGSKILQSDLAALATTANSLAPTNFNLAPPRPAPNFYDVFPLYNDGSGNAWGHREMQSVAIDPANRGTGYVAGDQVSAGYASVFEIAAVDGSGAALAIRILSPGAGAYADPSTISTAVTGGTGTGLHIKANFNQVGPTASYSFPDFILNGGGFTSVFVVNGGTGYNIGDQIVPNDYVGHFTIQVSAVSGGVITAAIILGTSVSQILPGFAAMATTAGTGSGTGAIMGGLVTLGAKPNWLTELNRLRNAIYNLPGNGSVPAFNSSAFNIPRCVSGPWPVGGPNANFANTNFYFADSGSGATVTVSSPFPPSGSIGIFTVAVQNVWTGGSTGFGAPDIESYGSFTFLVYPYVATQRFAFVIGGQQNLAVNGTFVIDLPYNTGAVYTIPIPGGTVVPDGVDPRSLVNVNQSPGGGYSAFPGTVTKTTTSIGGVNVVEIAIAVNQTLAPGRYELEVDITNPGDDTFDGVSTLTYHTRIIHDAVGDPGVGFGELGGSITTSINYSSATARPGIHNSLPVKKIQVPGDGLANGPGIYAVMTPCNNNFLALTDTPNPGWPTTSPDQTVNYTTPPTFGPDEYISGGLSLSTSVPGLWTSMTEAVSSLNAAQPSNMPWNLQRHTTHSPYSTLVNPMLIGDQAPTDVVSNTYDNSQPVESQAEPPQWVASTYFTAGFQIIDGNGNLQTASTNGTSGSSAPAWSIVEGQGTTDGAISWVTRRVLSSTNTWLGSLSWGLGVAIKDSNGNTQVVTTAGVSGATAPVWSKLDGQTTADGTVIWSMRSPIKPMPHRQLCVPIYPVYWESEPNIFLLPPTGTSGLTRWGANNQWQPNVYHAPNFDASWQKTSPSDTKGMAYGWFIYSIRLDRMLQLPGSQVSVIIGCIRSGSFVSFGTYNTGAVYQVLWPIFTSDALVYQCTERIDFQAVAIAVGGSVSTGATAAGYPVCAAFVSDTTSLLGLVT